jgi:hypothetical protein
MDCTTDSDNEFFDASEETVTPLDINNKGKHITAII